MGIETVARPRAGFFHRLQCARDGHYWERELSDEGDQARWVCIRCGKQGDTVPLVSSMPVADEAVPAADRLENTGVISVAGDAQPEVDDAQPEVTAPPQPEASEPQVSQPPQPEVSEPQATVYEPEDPAVHDPEDPFAAGGAEQFTDPPPQPETPVTSGGPSMVAVAVVSLVVVGGIYLAFRRRRRRSL